MARLTKAQENEILSLVRAAVGEGIDNCDAKHSRWEENQRYTRGLQWSEADIQRQERREKPAVPWNDTFKVVHSISNREMVSRLVPKVFGRNAADEGVANILDEACRWQRQYSESEHYESMGFRSAAMCGYGVVHKYWDPVANEGDGMIRDEDVPLCEMLWPSRAREMNLADRRWHTRGQWLDLDEADELWGDANRTVRRMLRSAKAQSEASLVDTSDLGHGDGTASTSSGWGWGHIRGGNYMNLAKNEVFVIEHEWLEVEYKWKAAVPIKFYDWVAFVQGGAPLEIETLDPQTQQPTVVPVEYERYAPLPEDQKAAFRDAVLADTEVTVFETRKELNEFEDLYEQVFGEEFPYSYRVAQRVVKFAVVIKDKVVENGVRPWGFSYHFITGFPFESKEGMDFFGVVDIVKGPQDYKNALISNMLAMYMSSPKGTLGVEKSAVPNINELADQIASPSGLIIFNDGALRDESQRIKFFPAPNYPPMLGPLLDLASKGVENSLGLSAIDLGGQDDLRRISGKVVQSAQLASNVIVAVLFDSMRKFRRGYGLCNVRFINFMYEPEELIRIVGDEKAADVPADDKAWGDVLRYDIAIDEQPSSPTELMETLDFLTRTGELSQMRQRGDIQFEDQLELMPQIPASIKRKILENNTVAAQNAALQQQMGQMVGLVESMRQYLSQSPEGQSILASFSQMTQHNQGQANAAQARQQ